MKSLSFVIFCILFLGFNFAVNAQLCGKYETALIITDEENKPIEDVVVKIIPLLKENGLSNSKFVRDKENPSRFSIAFNEGYQVRGDYRINIFAKGFLTAEMQIRFPHCKRQKFEFKLIKTLSQTSSQRMSLIGTVFDTEGSVIKDAKIVATDPKGNKFDTTTNDYGIYSLLLPLGYYNIEASAKSFCPTIFTKYKIVDSTYGKMNLDFVLEVASTKTPCNAENK